MQRSGRNDSHPTEKGNPMTRVSKFKANGREVRVYVFHLGKWEIRIEASKG